MLIFHVRFMIFVSLLMQWLIAELVLLNKFYYVKFNENEKIVVVVVLFLF